MITFGVSNSFHYVVLKVFFLNEVNCAIYYSCRIIFSSCWLSVSCVQLVGSSSSDVEEIYFDFRKQCFIYSKEKETFFKLSYPSKESFGYYHKSTGHGSEAKVVAATEKWGRNVWVSFLCFPPLFHIHLLKHYRL